MLVSFIPLIPLSNHLQVLYCRLWNEFSVTYLTVQEDKVYMMFVVWLLCVQQIPGNNLSVIVKSFKLTDDH